MSSFKTAIMLIFTVVVALMIAETLFAISAANFRRSKKRFITSTPSCVALFAITHFQL